MSENITHVASTEDSFHFITVSDRFSPEFKRVSQKYVRLARLTSVTRGGDRFSVSLLDRIRTAYKNGKFDETQDRKLAFTLGWICHRAADRCMKPVFHSFDSNTLRSADGVDYTASDCSIYNDAVMYNVYYSERENNDYPQAVFEEGMESIPGHATLNIPEVRNLSRMMMQNSLLAFQNVAVHDEDFDIWLDEINLKRQRFTLELERYYDAIFHPDPDKYARYITEAKFYDRDEPLPAIALKLRAEEPVSMDELQRALSAKPVSSYAHILHTAHRYLLAANEFFMGEMKTEELRERLDIGKIGRDGLPA